MSIGWNPRTEEELQAAFEQLVHRAYENGVLSEDTVYSLRHDDPDKPDWELVLARLSKPTTNEITGTDSDEINDHQLAGNSSTR